MDRDKIEDVHRNNISRLVEEFGSEHTQQVEEVYGEIRKDYDNALVQNFVPVFTYRGAKESLSAKLSA